jgi:hypothetical protein
MAEEREAMLRPEFADWYPNLQPDWWYPAEKLAELVVEQRESSEPRWDLESRVPCDEHFLYRGGNPRGHPHPRTRRSDSRAHEPSSGDEANRASP